MQKKKKDVPKLFKKLQKYGSKKYGMTKYKDNIWENIEKFYVLYENYIEGFAEVTIPSSRYLAYN